MAVEPGARMPPQQAHGDLCVWSLCARPGQNHSTQDSRVVPHRGTNWAALRLTAQIGRDAVLSESYGRGYKAMYAHLFIQTNTDSFSI